MNTKSDNENPLSVPLKLQFTQILLTFKLIRRFTKRKCQKLHKFEMEKGEAKARKPNSWKNPFSIIINLEKRWTYLDFAINIVGSVCSGYKEETKSIEAIVCCFSRRMFLKKCAFQCFFFLFIYSCVLCENCRRESKLDFCN